MKEDLILRFHSSNPKFKQINYIGRTILDQKLKHYAFVSKYSTQLGENNKFTFMECDSKFKPLQNTDINKIDNIEWYKGGEEFDEEFRKWLWKFLNHKIVGI